MSGKPTSYSDISGREVFRYAVYNSPKNIFFFGWGGAAVYAADYYDIPWLVWLLAVPLVLILGFNILQFLFATLLGMVIAPLNVIRALFTRNWEALKDEALVTAALLIQLIENFIYVGLIVGAYLILFPR